MTTSTQDQKIGDALVECAVEMIKDICDPDDIFEFAQLQRWAADQEPEDIYAPEVLEKWAKEAGYVQAEE